MRKCRLLITCANLNSEDRSKKYIECFESAARFENEFLDINVVETVSAENSNYFYQCRFKKEFSNIGNLYTDKGYNWLNHAKAFLDKSDYQHYIFLTGRYLLLNNYFITVANTYDNYKLIAKNDADIYGHGNGVHMFYFYFQKDIFMEFYKFCFSDPDRQTPIEWKLKRFMEKRNDCLIIPSSVPIGVEARISSGIIQKV
jgi:hypothetical protein